MAIYGDTVSDADFSVRLKEFQSAQAEIARLGSKASLPSEKC